MKTLKSLLVIITILSLTIHPALIDYLLADELVGSETETLTMSSYTDSYSTPEEAYVPPPPEPATDEVTDEESTSDETATDETAADTTTTTPDVADTTTKDSTVTTTAALTAAPVTNDASTNTPSTEEPAKVPSKPGETLDLNGGVSLTGQDDGSYKDQDGNKWIGVKGDDGTVSYRQLGYPAGHELDLTDGTKLTSKTAYELNENGSFQAGVWFTDQKANRWVTQDTGIKQIDYDAGQTITLSDNTKLTVTADFSFKDDGTLPDNAWFTDTKGNRWESLGGGFKQIDYQAGDTITLGDTDKTKLTATAAFSFKNDGTLPDNAWFTDTKGNRWESLGGGFKQIDYQAGDTITLGDTDKTKLTATAAFSFKNDGTLPDNAWFTDTTGNRWESLGGGFKQIDYPANSKITLSDGTVLTNTDKFSYNNDGTLPDGVKFTDDKGNKWISSGGQFTPSEFQAQTKSITTANGAVLTNSVPYELNADGTIPEGVLFKDQKGVYWISGTNGQFTQYDSNKTPIASLPIVKKLQGMSSSDASTLLSTFDPALAGVIMLCANGTAPVFTDQQVGDMLKGMTSDNAGNIVDKIASYGTRMPTILGSMDPAAAGKILSSDNVRAVVDAYLLTQTGITAQQAGAILNNMDSGRAAQATNLLFMVSITPIIHKDTSNHLDSHGQQILNYDPNPLPDSQNDFLTQPLSEKSLAQISAFKGALANMDPAKAAAMFDSSEMNLTTAGKALLGVTGQVIGNDGNYNIVSDPVGAMMAELAKLDPERAQSVGEVLAYYKAFKATPAYPWQTPTAAENYNAALNSTTRPLTASEKEYYTTILGFTPQSVKETYFQGTLNQEFVKSNPGQYITENVAYGSRTLGAQGLGAESYYIKGVLSLGVPGSSVDLAGKIAALSPADAVKFLNVTDSATAASILTDSRMTVDQAGAILTAVGKEQSGNILDAMDKTNAVKADDLRVKVGIDPDIKTMTADAAGEYIAGLDVAKAAIKLSKLGADQAAAIVGSSKLTSAQATKILSAMLDSKSTVTKTETDPETGEKIQVQVAATPGTTTGVTVDSSAVVDILKGVSTDKAAEILSGLNAVQAASIISSDKISVDDAGVILTKAKASNAQAVTNILAALDTSNKAKSDLVRAKIGAVPGTMAPTASAQYLTTLDNTTAAAELAKLTPDQAAEVLIQMTAATAGNILKSASADKAASYIASAKMSVEAGVILLTGLKISDAAKYNEIMAKLSLDTANKDKVGQITTAMDKIPASQKVASSEQTRLKTIYGYMPAFSTKETIAGVNGAPDSYKWTYYNQDGIAIGTRVDANAARYYEDGYGGQTFYDGYNATYYDITGKAVTTGAGGFQKISADTAKSLTDLLQAQAVYVEKVTNQKFAGGGSTGVYNYYDENFNLIGSTDFNEKYMGIQGMKEFQGYTYDKSGTRIMAGNVTYAQADMKYTVTNDATTHTITAGSTEEQTLLSKFGVTPVSVKTSFVSSWWDGTGGKITDWGGTSGISETSNFNVAPMWVSSEVTAYYDKAGNFIGSSKDGKWFDRNGDELL